MHSAFIFATLDQLDDDIRQPRLQRHRIRPTKRQHRVRVTHAKKSAGARHLVAKRDGFKPEPLAAGFARRPVIGDIRCVRQVNRICSVK